MKLMTTLDDSWNNQDWETFKKRHAENVLVYWPSQPDATKGREAHYKEAAEFFKTSTINWSTTHTRFFSPTATTPVQSLTGQ